MHFYHKENVFFLVKGKVVKVAMNDLYLTRTDDSGQGPQKNIIYLGITIISYHNLYFVLHIEGVNIVSRYNDNE